MKMDKPAKSDLKASVDPAYNEICSGVSLLAKASALECASSNSWKLIYNLVRHSALLRTARESSYSLCNGDHTFGSKLFHVD